MAYLGRPASLAGLTLEHEVHGKYQARLSLCHCEDCLIKQGWKADSMDKGKKCFHVLLIKTTA